MTGTSSLEVVLEVPLDVTLDMHFAVSTAVLASSYFVYLALALVSRFLGGGLIETCFLVSTSAFL